MAKTKDNDFIKTMRFHGISKRRLGSELQISQPTIKAYCENPQKFRLDQLRTIGRMTDLNMNDLNEIIPQCDGEKNK
jgi:predicted transcriptional regulator